MGAVHSPVYENYDENNEGHNGCPHPDAHLGLNRKGGLGMAVVLDPAQ